MYVKVAGSPADPTVTVEEGDDCTRLHVAAVEFDEATTGAMLNRSGLGRPGAPGHMWLDIAVLRARSHTGAPDWPERFDAMIAYAEREGWLDPSGKLVAAHVAETAR